MISFLVGLTLLSSCTYQKSQEFNSSDITHFWEAYDSIASTTDTLLQMEYLNELYLKKGSPALKDLMMVRRYSPEEYLNVIKSYPKFWKSIRPNTLKVEAYKKEISKDIEKLRQVYPDLKPAKINFLIGAFRTNGTIKDDNVLIGAELAFADENTVIDELPEWRQPFYKEYNPLKSLALLCTHEYIHTQQSEMADNLLSACLYEGVGEYVSCLATGKPSDSPAIVHGKENLDVVVDQFVHDMFHDGINYNWLWGQNRNHLKVRDLGYFIGYEICERYYNQSPDKIKAVKDLIELDHNDQTAIDRVVDAVELLPRPIAELRKQYEDSRPMVAKISQFENGATDVSPHLKSIKVVFSQKLNGLHNGLDFGPLGKEYYPKVINETRQWGQDSLSYSFGVELEPNKKYQMTIGSNFRLEDGTRLKPYTIEFQTTN